MMAPTRWSRLAALGLLSAGGLLLEVTLTRLFSALFYPPYVFVVLSLAVLGIGLGAAAASQRAELRQESRLPLVLALAGLSTVLLTIFAIVSAAAGLRVLLFLLVAAPFFFIGLALAAFFGAAHQDSPRLYLADLTGAGLGALLSIPILNWLGGSDGLFVAAAVFCLAGLAIRRRSVHIAAAAGGALALLLIFGGRQLNWLRLDMADLSSEKPISESLGAGGRIVATEWDSFARTDLVDPGDGGPYQLFMDGAAGSVMPPGQGADYLLADIGMLPFASGQPERVFVIGPGGGLDVWFGMQSGAEEIVAVEVNPASVRLVKRFADYNGDLYGRSPVRVVVDEGRSVLRREQANYDLITLSQVVTLAAERSGYALTENTIYTVEAFQEYLAHLEPQGQIAIKLYDELTLTRALSTALAALRAQGLTDAEGLSHTAALLDVSNQPPIPMLLVSRNPLSVEQSLELGRLAQRMGFVPLYLPGLLADPPLDAVEGGALTFGEIVAGSEADISPTSDAQPFFYQFERGIPGQLRGLLTGLAALVVAGAALLARGRRRVSGVTLRRAPLYFACLGAGFMAIELAVIQQTRLFLGHPTLAITTVLAVLLIGGGIGSGLAGRWWRAQGPGIPHWPALAVALLTVVWLILWPALSDLLRDADVSLRVATAAIALLPLALAMGVPFPQGLRTVGRGGGQHVALGWAVNGVMTVVGSAGAMAIAIAAGFSASLLGGAICYAAAGAVAYSSGTARSARRRGEA